MGAITATSESLRLALFGEDASSCRLHLGICLEAAGGSLLTEANKQKTTGFSAHRLAAKMPIRWHGNWRMGSREDEPVGRRPGCQLSTKISHLQAKRRSTSPEPLKKSTNMPIMLTALSRLPMTGTIAALPANCPTTLSVSTYAKSRTRVASTMLATNWASQGSTKHCSFA